MTRRKDFDRIKALDRIADGQKDDIEFSNWEYKSIVSSIQNFTITFGINIVGVHLERKEGFHN